LNGYICKQPTLRNTPTGKQIADLLVACNFSKDKSAYIPVISWGREARKSGKYIVGTEVKILGRIQSRKYTKIINEAQEEFVAYELSANQIDCVTNISD
jgi:single-stranded DNA-binding protein